MSLPSSPQAISHDFPSVHLVDASISLLRCPKLFPTVSPPSTLSSLQSRSFPTKLSPSYFPRFPLLPPCRRFHLAPSQRSSYFPRLPVHPCRRFRIPSISLLPNGALPKLFPTVLRPPCRRFNLAPSNGALPKLFPTVLRPPCRRFNLAPSNGALPKLFPAVLRPPCRRFHHAPSQLSPPQAISHSFPSVHPLVASISLPSRQSQLNENASIGDAFGKNT